MYKKKNIFSIIIAILFCGGAYIYRSSEETAPFFPLYQDAIKHPYPKKRPVATKNDRWWQILEKLYTENLIKNYTYSQTPRIPKIIHQIWIDNPFPEHYKPLQQSIKNLHPTWQYKLWTNADLEEFKLENQAAFDASENPGERSDIWRYEILKRYGGVYLDCDFQCIKPFDLLHHICDFYAGSDYYTQQLVIYNGLIACAPEDPIIEACIKTIKPSTKHHQGLDLFLDIHKRTGPRHFTINFFKNINNYKKKAIIFPATFFYPWPNIDRNNNTKAKIESWIKPETYAIHHWGVSWLNGELPIK